MNNGINNCINGMRISRRGKMTSDTAEIGLGPIEAPSPEQSLDDERQQRASDHGRSDDS